MSAGVSLPRQRVIAFTAVLVCVGALLLIPSKRRGDAAHAAVEPCGADNANRAALRLDNSAKSQIAPCIADVPLKLKVDRTNCSFNFLDIGTCDIRWRVNGINIVGQESVKMADGSSRNLWHLSFKGFNVVSGLTMTTSGGAGYSLAITPDSTAQLGGKNAAGADMRTDMWVSPASSIVLEIFKTAGFNCNKTWTLSSAGGLLKVLPAIDIKGCGFDMDVYYLISYNPSASPDDQSGNYPIRLPDTSLTLS